MKTLVVSMALAAAIAFALAAGAYAQQTPAPAQSNTQCTPGAPKKIEGTVTKVDTKSGMITLRTNDGKTQEFRGSAETVKEYKVGDKLEANLRAQNC
jgi:Cu/Ag efflux protein CusF